MNLIVETDIGRDPDDFFALCYLISSGVDIRAITISPGDLDQVAVTKFLLKEIGLDIPVGVGKIDRDKRSVGGVHKTLLNKYGFPAIHTHDGHGPNVIKDAHKEFPDAEFFSIGPLMSVGRYVEMEDALPIKRATMQGGFIGYDMHKNDVPRLDKFEGLTTCATFNLGGDKRGAFAYVASNLIRQRFWIGKNICHTIVYDREVHEIIKAVKPKDRAGELLREGMGMYLEKHKGKKFHDPSAAACMLNPSIATYVRGKLHYNKGKWGTLPNDNGDHVCVNIDKNRLWQHISEGN